MATLNLGPDMERFELAARKPPLPHPREAMVVDMCMPFTYGFIDRLAGVMLAKGIKPELEIYQPGQYWVSRGLAERGLIKPPYSHQFVMGVQTAIVRDALERAEHAAGAARATRCSPSPPSASSSGR